MVLQDRNLVAFQLSESDQHTAWESTGAKITSHPCDFVKIDTLRFLFHSIRDENPSFFGRRDRAVFPTGVELTRFSEKVYQTLEESYKNPFLFFVWKEDDSLNPFTRIRRTSFYLFCEKDTLNIAFGEWKKDIVFQNQFTFSEWIASPRFQIRPNDRERFFILESSRNRMGFRSQERNGEIILYPDWLVVYNGDIPVGTIVSIGEWKEKNQSSKKIPNPDPEKPGSKQLGDRLRTLEDLKNQGLITEDEYKDKRNELLNSL